jgi:uncharacterized protein
MTTLLSPIRRHLATLALALTVLSPSAARAQDSSAASPSEVTIPAPVGFVNDHAGLMNDEDRAKLEAFLAQVKEKTGAEFAVLTVRSSAPLDPADYKVKVFERWGLGKKGENDGLLLLIDVDAHRAVFETGYGLEGVLPDGLESRIVREEMVPRFRANDFPGGITAGVLRAAQRIAADKGVTLEWNGAELRYDERRPRQRLPTWMIALLVAFFFLSLFTRSRGRGSRWIGPGGFGGMGGWGGGFGGGGFGGGGGGGGGSFGGFGGGGSGGGGGGGSW